MGTQLPPFAGLPNSEPPAFQGVTVFVFDFVWTMLVAFFAPDAVRH